MKREARGAMPLVMLRPKGAFIRGSRGPPLDGEDEAYSVRGNEGYG